MFHQIKEHITECIFLYIGIGSMQHNKIVYLLKLIDKLVVI